MFLIITINEYTSPNGKVVTVHKCDEQRRKRAIINH
jgi:hypothetical protein